MDTKTPHLVSRALFCDDRGHFENVELEYPKLKFNGKRVYICSNFEQGLVRAFHYHRFEAKIFICLRGAAKFILLKGADNATCANGADPETFVISSQMPGALYIPPDYANGWQSLTPDTLLLGISNKTVADSKDDDIRFDPKLVHPTNFWETKWR